MRTLAPALVLSVLLAPAARAEPEAAPSAPAAAPAAPGPDAEAQAKKAGELRAMFERELGADLPKFPFEAPGGVKGSVPARSAPEVKADGPEIVIPLGTEQAVSCTVVTQRLDAGGAISRMVAGVAKEMKLLAAQPVAVAVAAGSALVFAEIAYQAQTPKGPMVGLLKMAVYAHDAHSLLCHHDEPGYSKTFQRVVASLASSLEGGGQDERAGSRYAEIQVMRVAGVPIGYSEMVMWDRKGGGTVEAEYETQLMPRSQSDLVAIDGYRQEALDAAGLLLEGTYAHVANGEVDSKVKLSRGKDPKTFRYEGEKQGKKLAGTFRTKAGLASDLWFASRFGAKAGYGPAGEVKHEAYSFTANPAAPTPISYRKDASRPRHAEMAIGPVKASGELDESGLFKVIEVPVGPAKLVVERVWSRGTP